MATRIALPLEPQPESKLRLARLVVLCVEYAKYIIRRIQRIWITSPAIPLSLHVLSCRIA